MTDLSKWNDLASGIHALSLIAVHVSRLFTDSGKIYSFTLLSTFTLYALDEHTFMPSQYILPQSSQMAMYFSGNVECYKINDWTRTGWRCTSLLGSHNDELFIAGAIPRFLHCRRAQQSLLLFLDVFVFCLCVHTRLGRTGYVKRKNSCLWVGACWMCFIYY